MMCIAICDHGRQCSRRSKNTEFCIQHLNQHSKIKSIKCGQDVKSRAGSTRNGYNVSFSNYNKEEISEEQIKQKNEELQINPNICFYCKTSNKEDGDHLIPTCKTKTSIYGQNNALNIVPSCKKCNSSKGSKEGEELKYWLKTYCNWDITMIDNLFITIEKNKKYLYFNKADSDYLNSQHIHINNFHEVAEKCAKEKKNIHEEMIKYYITNYPDLVKEHLKSQE